MMKKSIRLKYLFTLFLGGYLLSCGIVLTSLYVFNRRMETQFRDEAHSKTVVIAELLRNALSLSDYHDVQRIGHTISDLREVRTVEVANVYGDLIYRSAAARPVDEQAFVVEQTIPDRLSSNTNAVMGRVRIDYSYQPLRTLFEQYRTVMIITAILLLCGLLLTWLALSRLLVSFFSRLQQRLYALVNGKQSNALDHTRVAEFRAIGRSLNDVAARLADLRKLEQRHIQLETMHQVAQQVAHDIRSPLTALRVAVGHLAGVGEEQRVMMRRAVQRIEDITNDLARRKTAGDTREIEGGARSTQLVSSLIESLISEKRTQYRGRMGVVIEAMIDADTYGVFASVEPQTFKRVVSNLINNAVEAFAGCGTVMVTVAADAASVRIGIRDTGHGIPPEVLPTLMQRGVTVGKANGQGLGLFHARATVEGWGGTVALDSQLGVGTTVTLTLPRATPPAWFVPTVELVAGSPVVIIDDDTSIHQVWQERFAPLDLATHDIVAQHFSTSNDALAWREPSSRTVYLCDYELLGDPRNGLDLIERLGVAARAILVTSRYEEPTVQARCAHLGVRIVPKGLAGVVPVRVAVRDDVAPTVVANTDVSPGLAILVIDDDKDVRWGWTLVQDEFHITTLSAFPSMEACEAAQLDYATYAAAFVDKHIPDSAWSLGRTISHLKAAGVPRVIVASGEGLDSLRADPACDAADGFCQMKVPEELGPYLEADDPQACASNA